MLFFKVNSFLCRYWCAEYTTMTTISEFCFFKPNTHDRLMRCPVLPFTPLKSTKLNQDKFLHMQVLLLALIVSVFSSCTTSWKTVFGFWSKVCPFQGYTVIQINKRLVLNLDCDSSFLNVNAFFLSVVVKYFPAHYAFQWYFIVFLCWYVILEEMVWKRDYKQMKKLQFLAVVFILCVYNILFFLFLEMRRHWFLQHEVERNLVVSFVLHNKFIQVT